MDQFPRNMFRESGEAFASDGVARAAAKAAISRKWDMRIDEPARQFFYLPLMHSESLCDQDHCVRLICERMPETGASNLLHAPRASRGDSASSAASPIATRRWGAAPPPASARYMAQGRLRRHGEGIAGRQGGLSREIICRRVKHLRARRAGWRRAAPLLRCDRARDSLMSN